jgi:hypothetical protein
LDLVLKIKIKYMSVKIIDTAGVNEAKINTDNGLYVEVRPPALGALGSYCLATSTGNVAATLAANSTLFSMRWTDATRLCLVRSLRVAGLVTGTITTAVQMDLEAYFATSFSVSDSVGTGMTLTGRNTKARTSMGTSLMGDMRISTTVTLTAGTRTLDTQPLGRVQGFTGTVTGTNIFGSGNGPMYIIDRQDVGQYPIVLATNEGIVLRNPIAGPATGTFAIVVVVEWSEVAAY